jgi:hypothetical protein
MGGMDKTGQREALVRTVSERVKSPLPENGDDAALAEAISKLANHAREAVDATERASSQLRWALVIVIGLVGWSRWDDHRGNTYVLGAIAKGAAQLDDMEDTLGLVASAVVEDTEADMAEDAEESDQPPAGTARLDMSAAKEIIESSNAARRAPPETGSGEGQAAPAAESFKARVRAQGSALQVQHKLAEPEDKGAHVERYEKLKRRAKKAGVELGDLK